MGTTVNIHEAKTHLSRLLKRVEDGEEITIARAGKPIARLTARRTRPARRVPGMDKGKVIIHANFDDPLPEFDPDLPHALRAAMLPPIHRDPFDRMLIAQAQIEGIPLVTADPAISRYDVETIW